MHQLIHFVKVSGAGNDFVLVDNMDGRLDVDQQRLAIGVCSRRMGVGADGLLVIERSPIADFLMKYYNADGSSGGMCGNGGRCVARFAFLNGYAPQVMKFEALDFVYQAEITGEDVRLKMTPPGALHCDIQIEQEGGRCVCHSVNTGSPHAVVFRSNLQGLDVAGLGKFLRWHKAFAPEGTNVDFVQVLGKHNIKVRTYERGVEAETLACGTGSVASSVIAHIMQGLEPPIRVDVESGEHLVVDFHVRPEGITDVWLQGSAHILFEGKLLFDRVEGRILDFFSSRHTTI